MKRVTGIGGVFFKTDDPATLKKWYSERLGIELDKWGEITFQWREKDDPNRIGQTVFGAFKKDSDYFDPSAKPFMFNFRVADLHGLLDALRKEGVNVMDKVEEYEYGKFGWIMDPEGNKIELWEPPETNDPFGTEQETE